MFFPIVFVDGVAGQLFGDLAMTVVFSLLTSLVIALFVVPMLASRDFKSIDSGLKQRQSGGWKRWLTFSSWSQARADARGLRDKLSGMTTLKRMLSAPFMLGLALYLLVKLLVLSVLELVFTKLLMGALFLTLWLVVALSVLVGKGLALLARPLLWTFDRGFGALQRNYPGVLRGALRQRFLTVGLALGLFGGTAVLTNHLGMELIPELHQGEFKIDLRMPIGTNLDETAQTVALIEQRLVDEEKISGFSTVIGTEKTATAESGLGEHSALITVNLDLEGVSDIERREALVMARVRKVLTDQPDLQYELSRPALFTLQSPLRVEIRGVQPQAAARDRRPGGPGARDDARARGCPLEPQLGLPGSPDQLQTRSAGALQPHSATGR